MLLQTLSPIGSVCLGGQKEYPPALGWEWPISAAHWLHRRASLTNGGLLTVVGHPSASRRAASLRLGGSTL
jgi:hypothetical protein